MLLPHASENFLSQLYTVRNKISTDLASVGSFSGVYGAVLAECGELAKALATCVAVEIAFVRVRRQVTH